MILYSCYAEFVNRLHSFHDDYAFILCWFIMIYKGIILILWWIYIDFMIWFYDEFMLFLYWFWQERISNKGIAWKSKLHWQRYGQERSFLCWGHANLLNRVAEIAKQQNYIYIYIYIYMVYNKKYIYLRLRRKMSRSPCAVWWLHPRSGNPRTNWPRPVSSTTSSWAHSDAPPDCSVAGCPCVAQWFDKPLVTHQQSSTTRLIRI